MDPMTIETPEERRVRCSGLLAKIVKKTKDAKAMQDALDRGGLKDPQFKAFELQAAKNEIRALRGQLPDLARVTP